MAAAVSELGIVSSPRTTPVLVMAIKALADVQALARIAGLFAQFGVVPVALSSQRSQGFLLIDVQFEDGDGARIDILLSKVKAIVCVQRASLVEA
jgi:hypothetical protein